VTASANPDEALHLPLPERPDAPLRLGIRQLHGKTLHFALPRETQSREVQPRETQPAPSAATPNPATAVATAAPEPSATPSAATPTTAPSTAAPADAQATPRAATLRKPAAKSIQPSAAWLNAVPYGSTNSAEEMNAWLKPQPYGGASGDQGSQPQTFTAQPYTGDGTDAQPRRTPADAVPPDAPFGYADPTQKAKPFDPNDVPQ
jgi:hypothetical protein